MDIPDRSAKILGSVCLLSYLDSALRSCRRAIIWITKEKKEVEWQEEHKNAIRKLKKLLLEAPTLRKADYTKGKLIYMTVDTSGTGIGWVINQEGEDSARYAI